VGSALEILRLGASRLVTLRDISITLREGTPEWPGDTPYACTWAWRMADGASVNVSSVSGSPHVGTHADAPIHVQAGGAGVESLPLEAFVGAATVVDVSSCNGTLELEALPAPALGAARVLLRTGRTIATGSFPERWPVLSERCVRALLAGGLRLLGVDAPSVDDRESKGLPVHHLLFEHGACILENLDLRGAPAGEYELLAAPVKLAGMDAAPVRAVLRTVDGA
jgi:arylformamidase